MDRFISPEEHLQTEDIQKQIKGYYSGCSEFTNDGKLCRPSFSTNKLINPYTRKQIDCNWYCLRNCSPQKLLPIFKNIPKYIIGEDETKNIIKNPVDNVEFLFEIGGPAPAGERTTHNQTFILIRNKPDPKGKLWLWTDFRHYNGTIPENAPWYGEGANLTILAEQICQWFGSQNEKIDVSLKCQVRPGKLIQMKFSRFDIPSYDQFLNGL
jgi:hypothetical protein